MDWNPRFVLFAKSEGKKPEDLYGEEPVAGKLSVGCRFYFFINDMKKKFHKEKHPEYWGRWADCVINLHQDEFDKFLKENA